MTASAILSALLGVDGAGTGLDADKLDGQEGTHYLSRANHSGTQFATSISDLATTVKGYRLDEFAIPTTSVNVNNQKIINLANPTTATSNDAAPASWVTTAINNAVQGLDIKQSVIAATVSSFNISSYVNGVMETAQIPSALSSHFDGHIVNLGERVLVKNRFVMPQNGFYMVTQVTPTVQLTRVDFLHGSVIQPNAFVFVEQGDTLRDTGWVLSSNSGTVGTDNIEFVQFSSAGVITTGTGLSRSGNVISVDTAVVARKYSVSIGNGSATTFSITHGLATEDVYVSVREAAGGKEFVLADTAVTNTNTISVTFGDIPTTNQYRVTVIG
jgi:hypothetical protein